ncbi:MAG: DUF1015 family protein [Proteobacteria bacterium]|nr:DUF1015 family protein [Pseudomonadota bacterium]
MSLIRSFAGLRPAPEYAAAVAAPPYDVLSSDEARVRATGRPLSFLHISKPEIDLAPDVDPCSPAVYAKGAENFAALIKQGVLQRDKKACYSVYRLIMGSHVQTGIVAAASVAAYDNGHIRRHELTRPDKEDDRVRQIDALNAQTGPVLLTYRHSDAVDAIVRTISADAPEFDISADGGVHHALWVVRDAEIGLHLAAALESVPTLYIADGHHRAAAASRIAASRRAANPAHTGVESYNYFLSVIFPDNQMQIFDYNRVIRDLNGLAREDFIRRVEQSFSVSTSAAPVKPARAGEFGMYLPGQWYRLTLNSDLMTERDPVARLDVNLLAAHLIEPVLGINDPRRDKRIDFVGGIRGLPELVKRVDSGEMAVAFSLFPTGMHDLMAVADAGEMMPPKSTWFEPKLADGLVSHVLD